MACVWRSVPPPPRVGVGVKVELRLERFGSKSFPCWIMSPHVIFPSKNRTQVQGTIKRTYFLSSHGPPSFRSTSLLLLWVILLPFFFLNCNISSLTVTKFLIAFIKSPYGKLRCSNKKQWLLTPILVTGRLWLWPARVHVEIQAARFLTSITELRRCGSSEPVDPDFAAYSQIPAKEFFPGATWPMESCCLVQRSPDSILKQWEAWMVAKFILPWIWNPHSFMRIEKLKVVFALPRFTDLVDPVFTAYRS